MPCTIPLVLSSDSPAGSAPLATLHAVRPAPPLAVSVSANGAPMTASPCIESEAIVSAALKCAVTLRLPSIAIVHAPAPEHAPLHPVNAAPAFGIAESVTLCPRVPRTVEHRPVQLP